MKEQAEQKAREIARRPNSSWDQVETEITAALLEAEQRGYRRGVMALREGLEIAVGIMDRIKPATLDRGFVSASLETICGDVVNFKRSRAAELLKGEKV